MAKDPYRYFRIEARELLEGLSQGVLELEKGAPTKDVTARLLRYAHTLKGAARIVKVVAVAELAHGVEDALAPYREGHRAVPKEAVTQLLRLIESIAVRLASIDPAEDKPAAVTGAAKDEPADTVRVEIREVDTVLDGLSEALVQVSTLERASSRITQAKDLARSLVEQLGARSGDLPPGIAPSARTRIASIAEELVSCLEQAEARVSGAIEGVGTEVRDVRDAANRLRLVPASSIFPSLELATRDAAQSLDRVVDFTATGGDHRLDAHVLAALRGALLHAVRNAVAHGIEPSAARIAASKPPSGRVMLLVERRGSRVAFTCEDDGRGFDVEGLRRAATERGLLSSSEAAAVDEEGLFGLILKGGLTTTRDVTLVSGRAVGLDVVRETAARLRGDVKLKTDPGRGARVEISVPVSLSSLSALVVLTGDVTASVPLDAVRSTMRVTSSEIARAAEGDSVVYDGAVIPFLRLADVLQPEATDSHEPKHWAVLVVEAGGALAAVGVHRFLRTENVVMRPLPECSEVDAIVAGVSLDGEGQPQMVLDPHGLVLAARALRTTGALAPAKKARRPILVVDDSLTTRMLEQSILESAGYEVELATSAEEALAKATDHSYALFVVDVEMPGMSGFEFVTRTRADAVLREIPAILVTSRSSEEDLRRGREAGAHAYIVKGEFDQGYLLRTIRELVGS